MSDARAVSLADVDPVELPNGSWSRLLITDATVSGNAASLGYSVFTPGCVTDDLCHEVDEIAYVVAGRGAIRLSDRSIEVSANDAIFVPGGTWHTVATVGTDDLIMVFSFPSSNYPPTQHRRPRT